MATTLADVSSFLKGFFAGAWIGITERPDRAMVALNAARQKTKEEAAADARTFAEIGIISLRK